MDKISHLIVSMEDNKLHVLNIYLERTDNSC